MNSLYNRIEGLCHEKGVSITEMCRDSGASRGSLTDLKMGRKQTLNTVTLKKIADYFQVSFDYLIGCPEREAPPQQERLDDVYFHFAKTAQDNGIDPADIETAIAIIQRLREK